MSCMSCSKVFSLLSTQQFYNKDIINFFKSALVMCFCDEKTKDA